VSGPLLQKANQSPDIDLNVIDENKQDRKQFRSIDDDDRSNDPLTNTHGSVVGFGDPIPHHSRNGHRCYSPYSDPHKLFQERTETAGGSVNRCIDVNIYKDQEQDLQ
jgi:hypothetical protein